MTPQADHLSLETIQRLCEGLLPQMEQCFVEDHLAECDDCRGVLQRMDALLYGGFSAEAHAAAIRGEAYASDPLVVALRRAASQFAQGAAASLQRWLGTAAAVWGTGLVPVFGTRGVLAVSGAEEAEPIRVLLDPGVMRSRVRVAESRRSVQVEVSGGVMPRVALLFDPESDAAPVLAAFETAGGIHFASFEDVLRGEYLLALSPF